MMKKRALCAMLTAFLLMGAVSSCGDEGAQTDGTSGSGEETITLKYYGPGTKSDDQDKVLEQVNQKLDEDLGLNIEVNFIPWDAWDNKTNVMLSTGEEFDIFHIMQDRISVLTYASRKALTPLNEYLDKYPDLKGRYSDKQLDSATSDGKIYAIPANWCDTTGFGPGWTTVRKDLWDANGLEIPTTIDELIEDMKIVQANYDGDETLYAWVHELKRTPEDLHRTYDTWPFMVSNSDGFAGVYEDGTVFSFFESEEFKKDCEIFRELYTEGLIHPDILSLPADTRQQKGDHGLFLAGFGTDGLELGAALSVNCPEAELATFLLNPEKPHMDFKPLWNANGVPAASQHPEEVIQFFDWLYGSEENYRLFIYGIEGEHYTITGEHRGEITKNDAGTPLYEMPTWQLGDVEYAIFDNAYSDEYVISQTERDPNTEYHISSGFVFDSTPVATEYANVMASIESNIYPIKFGILPYEENIDNAISQLKAAGLDTVMEEYERQFKEFAGLS